MEFLQKIKGGIYNGIGIVLVLGITGIAYGAYTSMTDVTTGQSLTASLFNQIQENIRVLRTDVDKSSPAGAVMAFNLASCPTGWIIANGANGTPDLRGEFIRGLDSGRGIDSGRTIGTFQSDAFQGHNHSITLNGVNGVGPGTGGGSDDNRFTFTDNFNASQGAFYAGSVYTDGSNGTPRISTETRPRNVALLYCVKQ